MAEFEDKFRLDADCIRETDKAILVLVGSEELWIPKSQIDDDSEVWKEGDAGELVISNWIALEKGLA